MRTPDGRSRGTRSTAMTRARTVAPTTLARAKNVSVDGLVRAGIVKAGAGKVRLLERDELDIAWDPSSDKRVTVWEVCQHLIRRLDDGAESAAELLARVGGLGRSRARPGVPTVPDRRVEEVGEGGRSVQRPRRGVAGADEDCVDGSGRAGDTCCERGELMAVSNRERVGRALELLGPAMAVWVDRKMSRKSPAGGNWKAAYAGQNLEARSVGVDHGGVRQLPGHLQGGDRVEGSQSCSTWCGPPETTSRTTSRSALTRRTRRWIGSRSSWS
jgi:hypothetical protein